MSIAESLLPEFEQEMASTRRLLERVPGDKLAWKPHDKSMTLERLAGHVAEIPGWVKETMTLTELDLAPEGGEPYTPKVHADTASILAHLDTCVAAGRAALTAASDPDFFVMWSLKGGGQTYLTLPRIAVYRGFMMNHLIHHRAQLTVYLRLLDVAVPGMYGPTADEPNM